MSEFKFSCAACGQHIRCDTSYVGTKAKCPACQSAIVIPPPPSVPPPKLSISNPHTVPLPGPEAHAAPPSVDLPPPEPVVPKTSGLAVASLVSSLLTLVIPIGFIPGIICGHMAIARIRREPALGGLGLAKAGLVIGYVFLVIAVVVAILFSAVLIGALRHGMSQQAN